MGAAVTGGAEVVGDGGTVVAGGASVVGVDPTGSVGTEIVADGADVVEVVTPEGSVGGGAMVKEGLPEPGTAVGGTMIDPAGCVVGVADGPVGSTTPRTGTLEVTDTPAAPISAGGTVDTVAVTPAVDG